MTRASRVAVCASLSLGLLLAAPRPARADEPAAGAPGQGQKKSALTRDKADAMMDELGDPTKASPSATARSGLLDLQFFDALSGDPIPGATVTFRGESVTTNERGLAKFPYPAVPDSADVVLDAVFQKAGASVARGERRPEAERGYVTSKVLLHFMVGTLWNNRFSISPRLEPGKLRIVVDWGDSPADLDAHLVKAGDYHISFRDLRNYRELARLDRDATSGFGPETITVDKLDGAGSYTYLVHDYSDRLSAGSSKLGTARARVMVFNDQELAHTFLAPKGKGTVWTVFSIANGAVQPLNRLGDELPKQ